MGSWREEQINRDTNWFQVADQIAQSLSQVKNPVNVGLLLLHTVDVTESVLITKS